jgi:hypothetical protein
MKKLNALVVSAMLILGMNTGAKAANLVINGDFETGVIAPSTTDYNLPPNPTYLHPDQTYLIVSDPSTVHSGPSYFDHTKQDGTGLMMAVNAATKANQTVWAQSVNISPGENYTFSAWVSNWLSSNPAKLDFSINGNVIGTFSASGVGQWQQFSKNWNSGSSSIANLRIVDTTLAYGGDDFALDDISLTLVPEPTSAVLGLMSIAGLAFRRRSSK